VLTNDADVDSGDSKTVTTTGSFIGAHGTLTLDVNGSYSYAVNNADAAVDALRTVGDTLTDTFGYTMKDAAGATSTANLVITIHGANDAPVANLDHVLTNVTSGKLITIPGFALLANDTDAENDPLTIGNVIDPVSNGADTVALSSGNVTYTDNAPQDGSFQYTAYDGTINSADATVMVDTQVGDIVNGTANNDILIASNQNPGGFYTLNGDGGNDFLFGSDFTDILNGGAGNDFLFGGAGDDQLFGDAGNDVLNGDAGFDILYGGDGNDILIGGAGDDFLFGEAGMDIFKFDALPEPGMTGDAILDFSKVEGDKINLHDLLASFNIPGGTSNAFTEDYLRVTHSADGLNTVIQVDSDGGVDSFETLATLYYDIPTSSIDASDFIL